MRSRINQGAIPTQTSIQQSIIKWPITYSVIKVRLGGLRKSLLVLPFPPIFIYYTRTTKLSRGLRKFFLFFPVQGGDNTAKALLYIALGDYFF